MDGRGESWAGAYLDARVARLAGDEQRSLVAYDHAFEGLTRSLQDDTTGWGTSHHAAVCVDHMLHHFNEVSLAGKGKLYAQAYEAARRLVSEHQELSMLRATIDGLAPVDAKAHRQ